MSGTLELITLINQSQPLTDPKVKAAALAGVMDYFSSSLQAKDEIQVQQLLNWIEQEGGHNHFWLIGQNQKATTRQAALFNGFQAHLLDYDDVHAEVRGHPSAVILSALFSSIAQEQTDISGERFLSAYVIGIEVMARLALAVGSEHYVKGWHNTSTLGGIAATAAICYLHQYDFMSQALAVAATQASGLRLLFGTSIKPLHAGMAAQNAIQAVEWVKAGLSAECDFLDPKSGFLAVYGKDKAKLNLSHWGESWKIVSPGLWFKTYPYCSAASYVADAALVLASTIDVSDIRSIDIIFSPQGDEALIYTKPELEEQGRFSAEYITALFLLNKQVSFADFKPVKVRSDVADLMKKIHRRNGVSTGRRFVCIEVTKQNGQVISYQVNQPKGSPENPYTQQEMFAKLEQALNDKHKAEQFYHILQQLPDNSVSHFVQQVAELI